VRFDFRKVVAPLLLLMAAAGCRIEPPSDRISCEVHADCPSGFFCNERASGDRLCSRELLDAGTSADAGPIDAGWDAGEPDAGFDAGVICR
jgi:hypothetical protein